MTRSRAGSSDSPECSVARLGLLEARVLEAHGDALVLVALPSRRGERAGRWALPAASVQDVVDGEVGRLGDLPHRRAAPLPRRDVVDGLRDARPRLLDAAGPRTPSRNGRGSGGGSRPGSSAWRSSRACSRAGSKRSMALISPIVPTCTRSSSGSPRSA